MSYVRYVYIRLQNEVKRQFLFISVNFRLASNLRKKINYEKEFGKGLFGRLWLFTGRLWSFVEFCGRLLVVSGRLWWFMGVCGCYLF